MQIWNQKMLIESVKLFCNARNNMTQNSSISLSSRFERERSSNIELFRIVVMLLIVAHHYVVNSGLMNYDGPIYSLGFNLRSVFLLIFGMWGKIGINCFVLITGYFMCRSSIKLKKFLMLLLEVLFYRISIYFIFCISGIRSFSLAGFIKLLLVTRNVSSNFYGCFLLFYLSIPFLNILIDALNKRQHRQLIVLCMVIYVVFGTLKFLGDVTMNYVSWFIVLYFVASYIRLYPDDVRNDDKKLWDISLVLLIIVDILSVLVSFYVSLKTGTKIAYYFVTDSNTLLALLTGISAFMVFKNLKLKNSKWINTIAASTFGVLCIHANSDTMRNWLWKDLLKNIEFYSHPLMFVHAIGSVIGIFMVCVLIDQIRIKYLEKPLFVLVNKKWKWSIQ